MSVMAHRVSPSLLFVTLSLPMHVIGNLMKHGPHLKKSFASFSPSGGFLVPLEEEGEVFDADVWSPTTSLRQSKADGKEVRQQVNGSIPTAYIEIGTPPKKLYTIFDTGSDKLVAKTWSSVTKLIQSVDAGVGKLVKPANEIYCHDASSSYEALMEEAIDKNDLTSENKVKVHATGAIVYGSGAATTLIGKDTVKIAGISLAGFGLAEIQADKLRVLHQKDGTSAILGLQHMLDKTKGSSLFTRLRDEGHMHSFGYCRDSGNNGTFIWNDHSAEGYQVPVIGDIHWAVKMNSLKHEKPNLSDLFDPGSDEAPVISILEQGSLVRRSRGGATEASTPEQADSPFGEVHRRQKVSADRGARAKWIERMKSIRKRLRNSQHRQSEADPSIDTRQGTSSDWWDIQEVTDDLRDQLRHKRPSSASSKARHSKKSASVSKSHSHQNKQHSSDSYGSSSDSTSDPYSASSSGSGEDDIWASIFGAPEKEVKQPTDLCSQYPCAAVIDTGSNIIAGPKHAIKALTERVNIRKDCGNLATAPHLKIKLGNVLLRIPPSAYVMRVEMPAGGYDFASGTDSDSSSESEDSKGASQLFEKGAVDRLEELGGLSVGLAEPGFYRELEGAPPAKRLSKAALWRKVFDDLHKEKGIDFRHHFVGVSDSALSTSTVCMPAFSELDANTQHGKLWILGTPLFEKYYTRWEWPKENEKPHISFLEKGISKACNGNTVQTFETGDESITKATAHELANKNQAHEDVGQEKHMKKESTGEGHKGREEEQRSNAHHRDFANADATPDESLLQTGGMEEPVFYRQVKIEDIRFPHWARGLTQI